MREGHTNRTLPWGSGPRARVTPLPGGRNPFPRGDICPLLKGHRPGKATRLGSHSRRQRVEERNIWSLSHGLAHWAATPCLRSTSWGATESHRFVEKILSFLSFSYPLVVACLYLILLLFYFVPEALSGKEMREAPLSRTEGAAITDGHVCLRG